MDDEQPDMFMSGAQLRDEAIALRLTRPGVVEWQVGATATAIKYTIRGQRLWYEELRHIVETHYGPPPNPNADWGPWKKELIKNGIFRETGVRGPYKRPERHKSGGEHAQALLERL